MQPVCKTEEWEETPILYLPFFSQARTRKTAGNSLHRKSSSKTQKLPRNQKAMDFLLRLEQKLIVEYGATCRMCMYNDDSKFIKLKRLETIQDGTAERTVQL